MMWTIIARVLLRVGVYRLLAVVKFLLLQRVNRYHPRIAQVPKRLSQGINIVIVADLGKSAPLV
jgi:hypothetical protein